MYEINKNGGYHITVYHSFYEEVDHYKYVFKCDGPCANKPPYYGICKRAMNRQPNAKDYWFAKHQKECGGTFTLIETPKCLEENKKQSNKPTPVVEIGSKKIEDYLKPIKRHHNETLSIKSISVVSLEKKDLLILRVAKYILLDHNNVGASNCTNSIYGIFCAYQ